MAIFGECCCQNQFHCKCCSLSERVKQFYHLTNQSTTQQERKAMVMRKTHQSGTSPKSSKTSVVRRLFDHKSKKSGQKKHKVSACSESTKEKHDEGIPSMPKISEETTELNSAGGSGSNNTITPQTVSLLQKLVNMKSRSIVTKSFRASTKQQSAGKIQQTVVEEKLPASHHHDFTAAASTDATPRQQSILNRSERLKMMHLQGPEDGALLLPSAPKPSLANQLIKQLSSIGRQSQGSSSQTSQIINEDTPPPSSGKLRKQSITRLLLDRFASSKRRAKSSASSDPQQKKKKMKKKKKSRKVIPLQEEQEQEADAPPRSSRAAYQSTLRQRQTRPPTRARALLTQLTRPRNSCFDNKCPPQKTFLPNPINCFAVDPDDNTKPLAVKTRKPVVDEVQCGDELKEQLKHSRVTVFVTKTHTSCNPIPLHTLSDAAGCYQH